MFKQLPDDVAGKLIKHIFSYVNDEDPVSEDYVINALFEQIKATLKRDLQKWDAQKLQRSLAGKKSAEVRSTKFNERSTLVNETERKLTDSVNVNVNVNDIIYTFDDFWNLYGKKVDTKKCKDKFEKLSDKELEQIKSTLPDYIASTPDVQFRKNPLTYLNGKCWMDEIKKEIKLDWKGDPIL